MTTMTPWIGQTGERAPDPALVAIADGIERLVLVQIPASGQLRRLLLAGRGHRPGVTLSAAYRWLRPILPADTPGYWAQDAATVAVAGAVWMARAPVAARSRRLHGNLGVSLARLARHSPTQLGAVVHQRDHLVAARGEAKRAAVLAVVARLAGSGIPVDWRRLMIDLAGWGHPARYVQERIVRAYLATIEEPDEDDNDTADQMIDDQERMKEIPDGND